MPSYPGSVYTPTTVSDDPGGTEIIAAHHNNQESELVAIETELGTDVAGSKTDLKTRLAVSLADDGTLNFANSTVLTISSGAITVTQNWHRVATEGGGASDDLVTINGLALDGTVLFLRPSTANDVVLKNGSGNINCVGGADITLDTTSALAVLIYDANLSAWIAGKMSAGSEITTSSGAADNYVARYTAAGNIEGTSELIFYPGEGLSIGNGTAGVDYYVYFNGQTNDGYFEWKEDEDYFNFPNGLRIGHSEYYLNSTETSDYNIGSGGARVIIANKSTAMTVTLPAATATGRVITVKSIGAGACTVDGASSETIDGVASVILNQYESVTVLDYASGAWIII